MASRTPSGSGMTARSSAGITLLAVMVALALMIAVLLAMLTVWWQERAREKQAELLWVGATFSEAIGRYYEAAPDAARRYPERLEDLLEDARLPGTQRYLRKVYRDPITNSAAWGAVPAPGGGITGVYSRSKAAPIRGAIKGAAGQMDPGAKHYSDWKFTYGPPDEAPGSGKKPE
jgi:type II secretory pathway pseudopilin PulG